MVQCLPSIQAKTRNQNKKAVFVTLYVDYIFIPANCGIHRTKKLNSGPPEKHVTMYKLVYGYP